VNVAIFTDVRVFTQLESEWNSLVQRSVSNTIFATWDWCYHWWQAYQPGTLWVLALRDEAQRLVGLAPWFIEQHPARGRLVRCIGSDDVTDYLDVIVDRDCTGAVYAALAQTLADCDEHFEALDLSNIPADSPTRTLFVAALEQQHFVTEVQPQEVCPLIRLPESFEGYLETALDGKQRGEIRRKLRKAEGYNASMGTLSWYIVDGTHDLEAEMERFMQLMALSHPEKAAFLTRPEHVAFFRRIIPAALARGWLQLNFLLVDGEAAAAYFNFDYNGQILVYNSGLNPRKFADLSPGIVLLAYNIRHAIEQGRTVFDFLRGNEQYKYRMGAVDTTVYRLQAQPAPATA
jgi:CelD/BcsL family acetyltransferase involved in cellulose biosynthesis